MQGLFIEYVRLIDGGLLASTSTTQQLSSAARGRIIDSRVWFKVIQTMHGACTVLIATPLRWLQASC
jgi:hypothetical protein